MKAVVMGAGLAGVTTAWALANDGHDVTVVEREPQVAAGASFANGGIIAPSRAFPWPSPRMLARFFKALAMNDAGLRVRWRVDPEFWLWSVAFLANCSPSRYERNLRAKLRLVRYSQQRLHALLAETGIACRRLTNGVLYLYRSPAELERGWQRAAPMRELGIEIERLDPAQLAAREPALGGFAARSAGAIHAPGDEAGDAGLFCRELAARCQRKGVVFILDCEILGIVAVDDKVKEALTRKGRVRGDAFVCALGVIDERLREALGASLPVYPVKGYSASVPIKSAQAAPRHAGIDESRLVTWCPMGDEIRLTGGAEFAGHARTYRAADFDRLFAVAEDLFPGAADYSHARVRACLRPMTPESTPRFGTGRYTNLWFNIGHGHMGWAMAAGSARIIADLMSGRAPEIDLEGLRIRRG